MTDEKSFSIIVRDKRTGIEVRRFAFTLTANHEQQIEAIRSGARLQELRDPLIVCDLSEAYAVLGVKPS
jgi:DnaJ-domain-containing protein 1